MYFQIFIYKKEKKHELLSFQNEQSAWMTSNPRAIDVVLCSFCFDEIPSLNETTFEILSLCDKMAIAVLSKRVFIETGLSNFHEN